MSASNQHSRPPIEIIREALLHVRYDPADDFTPREVERALIRLEEQYEVARGSSESMGRALAAAHTKITGLEEQLEAAHTALRYIANRGIGSQATSNEHKAASMVVDDMRRIAQGALNPATSPEAR